MSLARPAADGESASQVILYIFIEKHPASYIGKKNDCDSRVPERAAKGCLKRKSGWNDSMTRCGQSATFCGIFQCWCLLAGTHLYFTIRLGFIQRKLPDGLRRSPSSAGSGGLSPYEALSTALAATIGTGNIIGISSAIALGGPGAVFWCWISGFFGMATRYAESVLSAACRADGSFYGGPMYVMEQLLHNRLLAVLFRLYRAGGAVRRKQCAGAFLDSGNFSQASGVSVHWIGIAAALLAGSILIGGAKKNGEGLYLPGSGDERAVPG